MAHEYILVTRYLDKTIFGEKMRAVVLRMIARPDDFVVTISLLLEGGRKMKRLVTLVGLLVFCVIGTTVVKAADEVWVVIQDVNGVYKVISAKGKTPKTVAGPFTTKVQAQEAKEKLKSGKLKPSETKPTKTESTGPKDKIEAIPAAKKKPPEKKPVVMEKKAEKEWFLTKDKSGVCRVIQAEKKTPTAIGGPYKTKEIAEKAKAEKCPPEKKKK
jgi:hypothetical protein